MMSYNLRAGAKGRHSNANVVAEADSKAVDVDGIDDIVATGSIHETGEHSQRKTYVVRLQAGFRWHRHRIIFVNSAHTARWSSKL